MVDFTKTSTAGTSVPLALSIASAAFADTWYVQAAPGGGMTLILNDSVHGDYPLPAPYTPYGPGLTQRAAFAAGPRGGVSFASNANPPNLRPPVPTAAGIFTTIGLGGGAWGGAPGTVGGLLRIRRIAVYGTELTPGQMAVLASTGSTIDAAAMAFDSGTIAAEVSDNSAGNLVLVLPAPASGRYLRLDLEASGATAIDIGRLVAGPLWQLQRSYAYGIVEGRQINDRVDINPLTGARFPVSALVNPRFAKFTLPLLTTAEARGDFRALTRALGGVGDLLWIPEIALCQAELNNRSLWGAAGAPGDLAGASRDSFVGSSRSFQITERV